MSDSKNTRWQVGGLGEVLWDVFPTYRCFGGAPANFASHAAALGANAFLVSAVGNDELGRLALAELNTLKIDATCVSCNENPTGNVQIQLADSEPEYEIANHVAWDFCEWTSALESFAQSVDAVCFGTLFQRSPTSQETTKRFLSATSENCLRVFDVNLRQNFFSDEVIIGSLKLANVLKINSAELPIVLRAVGIPDNAENAVDSLLEQFDLKLIALTRGAEGSLLVTPDERNSCAAIPVDAVDTVGAGDSFTACVVMGMLHGMELPAINILANEIAAHVCEQSGAGPVASERFLDSFKS